jgi:hypothetical protein
MCGRWQAGLKVGKYCSFAKGATFVEAAEDALVEA